MFFAVWWQGPRWERHTVENSNLGPLGIGFAPGGGGGSRLATTSRVVAVDSPGLRSGAEDDERVALRMAEAISRRDLSLDALAELAEHRRPIERLEAGG